jgi:hypothetical protein
MRHFKAWRLPMPVLLAAAMAGCATQAPPYQPSIDNVELLKKSVAQPVKLGSFTVQAGATGGTSIGLRGSSMASPVEGNYAAYLADALRKELLLAGKLDPRSGIEIGGELLKNDIAAGGISTNSGEIEARFVVRRDNQLRYEAVHRATANWESSLAGAVAIPRAMQQYPLLVQQLLGQLLGDSRFQAAIR